MLDNTTNTSRYSLLTGMLAFTMAMGCDADVETSARSAIDLDLSRYGIAEVLVDEGDHYRLIDSKGEQVGQVDQNADEGDAEVSIEFHDSVAMLAWSPDDRQIECSPATEGASDDPITACSRELTIAARIAEHEGLDVPGFSPVDEGSAFRLSCVTIETWVWGHAACYACYNEAKSQTSNENHTGGSCDGGSGPWTNCSHTFCSDGYQPEAPGEY